MNRTPLNTLNLRKWRIKMLLNVKNTSQMLSSDLYTHDIGMNIPAHTINNFKYSSH